MYILKSKIIILTCQIHTTKYTNIYPYIFESLVVDITNG